ncbi:acyl-CoA dehydrogenase family protein [soil metagenome]
MNVSTMQDVADGADERLQLVRDSASALLPRDSAPSRVRALRFVQPGFDRGMWATMCSLGWTGLRVPETHDGTGLDVRALCAVAQQLGASLSPEPLIACAAIAPLLEGDWLAGVLDGTRLVVPAWLEGAHDLGSTPPDARRQGNRVTAHKRLVAAGSVADAFVVSTREGLALIPRDAAGVSVKTVALRDGGFVADVDFVDAAAVPLQGALHGPLEEAALANAAYLLGAMEAAFDLTLGYLATRRQFGKPIGSFQALQHRAVDMKIQIELTRAVVDEAATALDHERGGRDDRAALVSRAKMRAGGAAMLVARESVQFHGAMGTTDECDIGLYLRKILCVQHDFGSCIAHRGRFAAIEQARHD